MNSNQNIVTAASTPLSNILNVLSVELHEAVASLNDVELTIAKLIGGDKSNEPNTLMNLQKVDKIIQTLQALADFTGSLAGHIPNNFLVDINSASQFILLETLSQKLRSCESSEIPENTENSEVDYFSNNNEH